MTTYALLIAVSDISSTGHPAEQAHNAIACMSHHLQAQGLKCDEQLWHRLSHSEQVDVAAVDAGFDSLLHNATGQDTIIVMFAGHGLQNPDGSFAGWALCNDYKYTPQDLGRQYNKLPQSRWIVLSDCCYGAAVTEESRGLGHLWQLLKDFPRRLLFGKDDEQQRFHKLATSTSSALHTLAASTMISIAAASKKDSVSDNGELLFATLNVGCSAGYLSYDQLQSSFDLASARSHAFHCDAPNNRKGDRVLT